MKKIKLKSVGPDVGDWQVFLSWMGYQMIVDGKFVDEMYKYASIY